MWQRIQTLYLAIATALTVSMLFTAKAALPGTEGETINYVQYTPYLILIIIVSLLNFLALTVYKHRIFQMRTAVLSALVTLALQVWLAVDFFLTKGDVIFRITAVFPAVALILDILAARNILADEMMVRSASRLRGPRKR